MKIFLKILKYMLYSIPLLILVTIIVRFVTLTDPPESRFILNTDTIESVYNNLGENFLVYEIRIRNPFTLGDTFRVLDAVYLESSRDFQLTLRSKKNRLEEVLDFLEIRNILTAANRLNTERFVDLLRLYLRASTRVFTYTNGIREETLVTELFEISASYWFENNRYEYIRVNFSGVVLDYVNTRLELFVFDNQREIDTGYLENADYLGRVTIFDIRMPKQRTRMDRLEILK